MSAVVSGVSETAGDVSTCLQRVCLGGCEPFSLLVGDSAFVDTVGGTKSSSRYCWQSTHWVKGYSMLQKKGFN